MDNINEMNYDKEDGVVGNKNYTGNMYLYND
jgi:hypothetical protein